MWTNWRIANARLDTSATKWKTRTFGEGVPPELTGRRIDDAQPAGSTSRSTLLLGRICRREVGGRSTVPSRSRSGTADDLGGQRSRWAWARTDAHQPCAARVPSGDVSGLWLRVRRRTHAVRLTNATITPEVTARRLTVSEWLETLPRQHDDPHGRSSRRGSCAERTGGIVAARVDRPGPIECRCARPGGTRPPGRRRLLVRDVGIDSATPGVSGRAPTMQTSPLNHPLDVEPARHV